MDEGALPIDWLKRVDAFLSQTSWEKTWQSMARLMENALNEQLEMTSENEDTDFLSANNVPDAAFSPEVA